MRPDLLLGNRTKVQHPLELNVLVRDYLIFDDKGKVNRPVGVEYQDQRKYKQDIARLSLQLS